MKIKKAIKRYCPYCKKHTDLRKQGQGKKKRESQRLRQPWKIFQARHKQVQDDRKKADKKNRSEI
jgi:ribosomal protein L44E